MLKGPEKLLPSTFESHSGFEYHDSLSEYARTLTGFEIRMGLESTLGQQVSALLLAPYVKRSGRQADLLIEKLAPFLLSPKVYACQLGTTDVRLNLSELAIASLAAILKNMEPAKRAEVGSQLINFAILGGRTPEDLAHRLHLVESPGSEAEPESSPASLELASAAPDRKPPISKRSSKPISSEDGSVPADDGRPHSTRTRKADKTPSFGPGLPKPEALFEEGRSSKDAGKVLKPARSRLEAAAKRVEYKELIRGLSKPYKADRALSAVLIAPLFLELHPKHTKRLMLLTLPLLGCELSHTIASKKLEASESIAARAATCFVGTLNSPQQLLSAVERRQLLLQGLSLSTRGAGANTARLYLRLLLELSPEDSPEDRLLIAMRSQLAREASSHVKLARVRLNALAALAHLRDELEHEAPELYKDTAKAVKSASIKLVHDLMKGSLKREKPQPGFLARLLGA